MSEENNVQQQVELPVEDTNNQPTVQQETPQASEVPAKPVETITSGYMVGLHNDGRIEFKLLGDKHGIVELTGLHRLAGHRLESLLDASQGQGVHVLAGQLAQLTDYVRQMGEAIKVLFHTVNEQKKEKSSIIVPR